MVGQEAMWLTCLLEGRKEVPNRGEIKTSDSFKDAVELLSDNIFLIIIEREQKKKRQVQIKVCQSSSTAVIRVLFQKFIVTQT